MSKNLDNNQESKKIFKNKYRCLVNPDVFVRKSKHNKSDEVNQNISKKIKKNNSDLGDDFWNRIN